MRRFAWLGVGLAVLAAVAWGEEIHDAVKAGDLAKVQALVKADAARLRMIDQQGATPLYRACEAGSLPLATALLDAGADISRRADNGWTPLHAATAKGADETVALLLARKAPVDAAAYDGRTPLFLAARNGFIAVAKRLLDAGADPNTTALRGETPLYDAIGATHNLDMLRLLIARGATGAVRTYRGETLLSRAYACRRPREAEVLVREAPGIDVNARGPDGSTPLMQAVTMGQETLVDALLERDADLSRRIYPGLSPLHVACGAQKLPLVRKLLAKGADPNTRNADGEYPLLQTKQVAILSALLEHGADPNVTDGRGDTLLHTLGASADATLVALCLAKGGNATARNANGNTPLHCGGNVASMRQLIAAGADANARNQAGETPLMTGLNQFDYEKVPEIVDLLIAGGADLRATANDGRTVLHYAAAYWNPKAMQYLLGKGLDPNVRDAKGRTPLFYCRGYNVAAVLVAGGADVKARDLAGQTALHLADGDAMAIYLLKNGADVDARDNDGRTPIYYAHHKLTAGALLDRGANLANKDKDGLTPLQYLANTRAQPEVAAAVRARGG
jgi:ankyrin repeat protein